MGGNLYLRNLHDEQIDRLKQRAEHNGYFTEAERGEILRQAFAVEASFDELAAQLRGLTARRKQTPSPILLREGCDAR